MSKEERKGKGKEVYVSVLSRSSAGALIWDTVN